MKDINSYTEEMKKSLIDKIFFVDKIESEIIVDYGCADATLLGFLNNLFPTYTYIGYDNSKDMLKKAKENSPDLFFTSNWNEILKRVQTKSKLKTLILSSIIHEIYTYSKEEEIKEFWNQVWNSGFDYIVIRDMMVSESSTRKSDPLLAIRIRQLFDSIKLKQWEDYWGTINDNWSLVHFLLTYRYEINWDREYKENYLPVNLENFLKMIPKEYKPIYQDHFCLPFVRKKVKEDFDLDLQENTHIKLILSK